RSGGSAGVCEGSHNGHEGFHLGFNELFVHIVSYFASFVVNRRSHELSTLQGQHPVTRNLQPATCNSVSSKSELTHSHSGTPS
ncbi:MAG: hypothetical protein LAT80_01855, partial [Balneolaceae bacterium]|nr:hypothetical protein [Balneolaceae bacterium]